ncbi:MAG: 2-C-methyl-D-erythritol 4-phosphate cytidylyltransferase [Flavobacteriales bacterium]
MSGFSVIITAGGVGKRMGGPIPKQFLEIAGKPILMHTLEKFHAFDPASQLVLTIPSSWKSYWEELLEKHSCHIPHLIVEGGKERYHSIKNALAVCSGDHVAVHDGVRPLVSASTIEACFNGAKEFGAAIPVIPVKESIRRINDTSSVAEDRLLFRLVQTPQCFRKDVLLEAYSLPYHDRITDDASLVEECGFEVHLALGNEENIKITSSIDLSIAEMLLRPEKE